MSALEPEIRTLILAQGPISVARYMELCLDHPRHGYYRTAEAFGTAGDFVTAPEISQMFGEIVGLFLAQAWLDLGSPRPVRLVELGPGRGVLMADLLRTLACVPALADALDVHLVERSPRLAALQRRRLGHRATWHERFETVPDGPMLLVANEFLDALPVHQLVWRADRWRERRVGVEDGQLAFIDDRPAADDLVALAPDAAEDGSITEVGPARAGLVTGLARRIAADGGVALLIDYGGRPIGPTGDTLQAVRAHQPVDPLTHPGEADLSAQVDFAALARAVEAAGAVAYGPVFQGTFLRTLGIELRAVRLMEGADPQARHAVRSALYRLADPSAMGELFKVLVIGDADAPAPPGFARHG